MIARIWTGATDSADAAEYRRYMTEMAEPGYRRAVGNRAVFMLCRDRDDSRTEFTMVTLWSDMDAVRNFAGEDPAVAVFYPEDERLLVEREFTVRHYEVYGPIPDFSDVATNVGGL